MEAISIEIINPKALQLIEGMQALNLIKIKGTSESELRAWLKKSRKQAASAPAEDEIAEIVNEVRAKRHAKK